MPDARALPELLTLAEVCARYHVSDRFARDLVRKHRVPVLKPGRRWLFDLRAEKAFSDALAGEAVATDGRLSWTEETIAANAFSANVSAVYFLLRKGKVVYVGLSTNILKRLGQHGYSTKFDAFFFIPCPPDDLLLLEHHYIRLFQPELNTFGVDRE